MQNKLDIKLSLTGEAAFFVQVAMQQTGKSFPELMTEMISLYKTLYFNQDQELAWIQGDEIVKKLNSTNLWRSKSDG